MVQFLLLLVILVVLHCSWNNVECLSSPEATTTKSSISTNKLLILGLGRVGCQVAELALPCFNGQVVGTVRQLGTQDSGDGTTRIPFDPLAVQNQLLIDGLGRQTTHVLLTIPLSKEQNPAFDTILDHVKEWWKETPSQLLRKQQGQEQQQPEKWMGILSTTGVYGNHDGKWVTEDSPLLCQVGSNADLYRKLEADWIQFARDQQEVPSSSSSNHRLCIFRCAGIYDSSRSALHTLYSKGFVGQMPSSSQSPSPTPTTTKTNRIHSLDLSRAVLSSMLLDHWSNHKNHDTQLDLPPGVRIYNLADDLPENREVVLSYAKELFSGIVHKLPPSPPVETISSDSTGNGSVIPSRSSAGRQSRRLQEQKLVSNYRMMKELLTMCGDNNQDNSSKLKNSSGGGLLFPTYREGLQNIFEDPTTPWQIMVGQSQEMKEGS
jgi:hypothetical protein